MTASVVALGGTAQVAEASNEVAVNVNGIPAANGFVQQVGKSSSSGPIAQFADYREAVGDDKNKMTPTQQKQYMDLYSKAVAE